MRVEMRSIRHLLIGVTALFLATGAAHSTDKNILLLFIAGDDGRGHITYGHIPTMSFQVP
jgi:hypothetical protein